MAALVLNTYFNVRNHGFTRNNSVSVVSLQAKNAVKLSSGIGGVNFVKCEFDVVGAFDFRDVQAKIAVEQLNSLLHLLFLT